MWKNTRNRIKLERYICDYAIKRGTFELSSGEKTDVYVDLRQLTTRSDILRLMGELVYDKVSLPFITVLAGVVCGAVPIVSAALMVAEERNDYLRACWVRTTYKKHGSNMWIDGELSERDSVWVFDDVATTGASLAHAVNVLRDTGCVVTCVTPIVCRDRDMESKFKDMNVQFSPMFYLDEMIKW